MKKILLNMAATVLCCNALMSQTVGDVSSVTDIDGNVYETKYCKDNNWWMIENLKVTKHPDGTPAKYIYPYNGTTKQNDESLVALGAGLLYDRDSLIGWPHALRAQGLCPNSWHVPSREEFENFMRAYGTVPSHWAGDGAYLPLLTELNLASTRGGKWDPTGSFLDGALDGWGVYLYTSTTAWGDKDHAFMIAISSDGSNGGVTQDPKTVAGNCRCVKNRDVDTTVAFNDEGAVITLSDSIIKETSQVKIYNVSDPSDKYKVDLTSVSFSTDKKTITVSAYLEVSNGEKYEIQFMDSQSPDSYLSGYNIKSASATSVISSLKATISIMPNPVENSLQVSMQGLRNIEVFSLAGQVVAKVSTISNSANIDLTGIAGGVYFVKAKNNNNESVTEKIIKK